MTIYVSGPISGRSDLNRSDFELARHVIERFGHKAIIPLDLTPDIQSHACPAFVWTVSMCRCLDALKKADAMIALWGWEHSRGARIEIKRARERGMKIYYLKG